MNYKRFSTKTGLLINLLLFLSLNACHTTKTGNKKSGQNKSALTGTTWNLTSLKGKTIPSTNKTERKVSFKLNEGKQRINGFSGCNTFMGQYRLGNGQSLQFSGIASTRMACPDNSFNENDFLKIFENVASYEIQKDQLFLENDKGKTLAVFKKSVEDAKITEKYWKLIKLDGVSVEMAENQQK